MRVCVCVSVCVEVSAGPPHFPFDTALITLINRLGVAVCENQGNPVCTVDWGGYQYRPIKEAYEEPSKRNTSCETWGYGSHNGQTDGATRQAGEHMAFSTCGVCCICLCSLVILRRGSHEAVRLPQYLST